MIVRILLSGLLVVLLTACSANSPTQTTKTQPKNIELGTIIQLKKVSTANDSDLLGSSVGVSIGSGGHRGLYGSFDLGKLFSVLTKPAKQLALMVKKQNGEIVAITQPLNTHLKVGDEVKIVRRNGRLVVQY